MTNHATEQPARQLAELLDQTLADEWETSAGALALLVPAPDGELELELCSFNGHPSEVLPQLPPKPGCVAACLSVLGHSWSLDDPAAPRRRIRSTVGVDHEGDVSLIRHPEGTVDQLHGVEGALADLLYSMLA